MRHTRTNEPGWKRHICGSILICRFDAPTSPFSLAFARKKEHRVSTIFSKKVDKVRGGCYTAPIQNRKEKEHEQAVCHDAPNDVHALHVHDLSCSRFRDSFFSAVISAAEGCFLREGFHGTLSFLLFLSERCVFSLSLTYPKAVRANLRRARM